MSRLAAALLALVLLAGCGSDAHDDDHQDTAPSADDGSAASPPPQTDAERVEARCLSNTPPDFDGRLVELTRPGMRIPAVAGVPGGRPDTGVLLLPQVSPGLCGWLPYAEVLQQRGAATLAMDMCGYGEAECADDDLRTQVDAGIAYLRDRVGVRRVVLVGASMGGSQTVRAVASGARVDGWVDLSGPSAWEGEPLLPLAAKLPPGLVMLSPEEEGPLELRAARGLAQRSGSRFVKADYGHGWEMLLDLDGSLTREGRLLAEQVIAKRPVRR